VVSPTASPNICKHSPGQYEKKTDFILRRLKSLPGSDTKTVYQNPRSFLL